MFMVSMAGRALTVIATLVVVKFGGGIQESCSGAMRRRAWMPRHWDINGPKARVQGYSLLILGYCVKLIWAGATIVASGMVAGLRPLVDVLMLTHLTAPIVVGWYGASRTIYGTGVLSPH